MAYANQKVYNVPSQKNNKILKIAIVVLSCLFLGALGYIFKLQGDKNDLTAKIKNTLTDKEKLQQELEIKIAEYGAAIADNTALKSELEDEQNKMKDLLEKVKVSDGKPGSLNNLRGDFTRLNREMSSLLAENKILKQKNEILTKNLDNTSNELSEIKIANDTLKLKNANINKNLEKGQKLSIVNFKISGIKRKSSGKEEETDRASRTNVFRITFAIAENSLASRGFRKYYVQIIDGNKNLAGESKTVSFKNSNLKYSFMKEVLFENKTMQIKEDLPVKDVNEGTLFVNLFDDNGILVGHSSITLE